VSVFGLILTVATFRLLLFPLGHFESILIAAPTLQALGTMAFLRTLLLSCAVAWAGAAVTPLDSSVQVRNAPGQSIEDTYDAIKRGLAAASLEKREPFKTDPINIARSWSGATLLSV
jgi:hypothetical protein